MRSDRNRRGHRSRPRRTDAPSLETTYFDKDDSGRRAHPDKKTQQLCRQVHRRLDLALAELEDPALHGLWVHSVTAEPTGRALVVHVIVRAAEQIREVSAHLEAARSHLRPEVANAIHRKRTPQLQFIVLPQAALTPEEEDDGF